MTGFRAAVLTQSSHPLEIVEIEPTIALQPGQVRVDIQYSGVCGAQINEIDAVKGPDKYLPHLLGHEGIGEVVEVGPLVETVAPGDTVVMHWMPGDGMQAQPASYLGAGHQINAGWVTTLSEQSIVSENRVTKVVTNLDPRIAPLLGCAATTAWGCLVNDAGFRLGESVVVLGTGGVGLLVVDAARAGGASSIVAVDMFQDRIDAARGMGATATVLSTGSDLETRISSALGGRSAEVIIETTGARPMIELAYSLARKGGRAVLVGVPRFDEPATIDTLHLHFGMQFTGSKGGGIDAARDIPRLAELAENGLYRLENLPLTVYPLTSVNEGIQDIRNGKPGRVIISMRD